MKKIHKDSSSNTIEDVMKKKLFIYILFSFFFIFQSVYAQNVIEIEPLFEYPTAPEELEALDERCDYIVKHFWDNFDFKNKQTIDQYALNEAFQVYVSPMRYASKKEVDQSIDKLLNKISGNPSLLLQFTKAAEENLYGPRAEFWSDPLYLKFLDAVIKNKKLKENRKAKYISQAQIIKESEAGNKAPSFHFSDKDGLSKTYFPMSTPTLLIFGNPDDTDWRLARLKMDSNMKLSDALEKGKLNIIYILPFSLENWPNLVSNYNSNWTIGNSPEASEHYDLRLNPSIYLIGSDGIIVNKFLSAEQSVEDILELIN